MAAVLAVVVACVILSVTEARLLSRRVGTPISEKVIVGEGPTQYQFVGSEITFNECYPYDVKKFSKIKVCGAGTVVKIYLRNRCEGYSHYVEEVDHCTGAIVTDPTAADDESNCMEVDPQTNHWLLAAQSWQIEQCGAATGQANDYEGPPCKTMEECQALAEEQKEAEQEKKQEEAVLEHVGVEAPQ